MDYHDNYGWDFHGPHDYAESQVESPSECFLACDATKAHLARSPRAYYWWTTRFLRDPGHIGADRHSGGGNYLHADGHVK